MCNFIAQLRLFCSFSVLAFLSGALLICFVFFLFSIVLLQTVQMRNTSLNFIPLIKCFTLWNSITRIFYFTRAEKKINFPFDLLQKLDAHNKSIWGEKSNFYPQVTLELRELSHQILTGLGSTVCYHVFFRISFQLINQVFHPVRGQPLTVPPNLILCQSFFFNNSAIDFSWTK